MAVNKMLHINEVVGGKNPNVGLKNAIEYISNPDKTQNGKNVFTINCKKETAFDDMIRVKKDYGKEQTGDKHSRQGYHFIISFSPEDNVSNELCNEITKEFCEKYFQNRYQVLIATHDDQPHKHSHIIFNSVALDNGLKYHYTKGDWKKEIMPLLNSLCEKHNLSTIELGGLEKEDLNFFNKHNSAGRQTIEKTIKNKIDSLIDKAYSFENLLSLLRGEGFKVNIRGEKTISITPPGFKRARKLSSLGDGYSKKEIESRIKNRSNKKDRVFEKKEKIKKFQTKSVVGIQRVWVKKLIRTVRLGNIDYDIRFKNEVAFNLFSKYMEEYWLLKDRQLKTKSDVMICLDKIRSEQKENKKLLLNYSKQEKNNKLLKEKYLRMEELKPYLSLYKKGDSFFESEAMEYENLKTEFKRVGEDPEKGLSDLNKINFEMLILKKKNRKLRKEEKMAENIIDEYVEDDRGTNTGGDLTIDRITKKQKNKS